MNACLTSAPFHFLLEKYVLVYAVLIIASIIGTFMRSEWVGKSASVSMPRLAKLTRWWLKHGFSATLVTGGSRAARRVFVSMLSSVLRAPMSYFETTPMGRVLNRFTYDMEVVDMTLTEAMSVLMIALGWGITGIIVMCTILPYMIFAIVPTILVYWVLMLHYRKSGADLQRLDAVARSPIQAMLAEGKQSRGFNFPFVGGRLTVFPWPKHWRVMQP